MWQSLKSDRMLVCDDVTAIESSLPSIINWCQQALTVWAQTTLSGKETSALCLLCLLCLCVITLLQSDDDKVCWNNWAWVEAFRGPEARIHNLGFWSLSSALPVEISKWPSYTFSLGSLFLSVGRLSIMWTTTFFFWFPLGEKHMEHNTFIWSELYCL